MSTWIIEPHEPLIFRDGRPFGLNLGARATSLPFPFPSTTTGGVRTHFGLNENGKFELTSDEVKILQELEVRGPLLVEITYQENGQEQIEWLAPAPSDALTIKPDNEEKKGAGLLQRLVPLILPEGIKSDLSEKKGLQLVGAPRPVPGKPAGDAPLYWKWDRFMEWLLDPAWESRVKRWSEWGHSGPQREQRIHIGMDVSTGKAKQRALFETLGMEFLAPADPEQGEGYYGRQLGLAVAIGDEEAYRRRFSDHTPEMREGIATFGSERRLVNWRRSSRDFPLPPIKQLVEAISEQKACRLLLLTPAYFNEGYLPTELLQTREGVTPELRAIAVQRPQVVSGWDIAKREAKPSRRLVPAGSVLFLELKYTEQGAIERWVRQTWMQCVSDGEQNRKDGFGLAVLGTWDGEARQLEGRKQA